MASGSAAPCGKRVGRLFARLRLEKVPLCVWKSADRWLEGLDGRTDIDILVAEDRVHEAHAIMVSEKWIPAIAEPWRRFDHLYDYLSFEDGRCLHIHLHTRIVAGEKMVKSLRPPLAEFYVEHIKDPLSYPPFVAPELEMVLFLLRTTLKISLVDIAGAFRRGSARAVFRNYQAEFESLRERCDPGCLEGFLQEKPLEFLPKTVMLNASRDIARLGWKERRELRRHMKAWRVSNAWSHCLTFAWRASQKRWEGTGKLLPFPGISLAICGPDGSGKTTTVDALQKHLSRHFRVSRFYMGSNMQHSDMLRGVVMKALWWPYLLLRKGCKVIGNSFGVRLLESAYNRLDQGFVHNQKRRRLERADRATKAGQIVLFERFPLFYPFGDDSAKGLHGVSVTPNAPDLFVFLDVDPSLLLKRRGVDSADILLRKQREFRAYRCEQQSQNKRLLAMRGDAPLDDNVSEILSALNELLSQRARSHLIKGTCM